MEQTTAEVPSSAGVPPAERTEGLFARKSSGLVRELGTRDAFSIAMGGIAIAGTAIVALVLLSVVPQADLTIPLLGGAAAAALLALVYAQLVATLPRAGGDYVFASRIFHPVVGAGLGGAVFLALVLGAGTNAILFAQLIVPFFFTGIGDSLGSSAISGWADDFSGKGGQFLLVAFYMLVVLGVSLLRPRSVARILFWLFGLSAVAVLILMTLFLLNDNSGFQSAFNATSGDGSYNRVLAAAAAAGFEPGVITSSVIAAIPFGGVTFLGLTYAVFPGGEIRRPSRTFLIAGLAAVGVTLFAALGLWLLLKRSAGLEFLQSVSFLFGSDPEALEEATSIGASPADYGLVLSGDPVTKTLISIGILGAIIAPAISLVLAASRVLFALSFDRLVPRWTTNVDKRSNAPVNAVLVALLVAMIFATLGIYTSVLTVFRNVTLVFLAIFVVASFAAIVLPYRRKDLYEASPKLFGRVGGVPLIVLIGLVSLAANGFLAYLAATKAEFTGGYDTGSVITLASVALVGVVAYVVSRAALSRKGRIDPALAMRELPPE